MKHFQSFFSTFSRPRSTAAYIVLPANEAILLIRTIIISEKFFLTKHSTNVQFSRIFGVMTHVSRTYHRRIQRIFTSTRTAWLSQFHVFRCWWQKEFGRETASTRAGVRARRKEKSRERISQEAVHSTALWRRRYKRREGERMRMRGQVRESETKFAQLREGGGGARKKRRAERAGRKRCVWPKWRYEVLTSRMKVGVIF